MAQITSDFLVDLTSVTDDSVQQVRKTAESPPRVSVYDVLGMITGHTASNSAHMFDRLVSQFPEVCTKCTNFKFPGCPDGGACRSMVSNNMLNLLNMISRATICMFSFI